MKKKIGITAAVILGILAVCYIGFAVFFQSHFCFGTTIDGIKVGGCSTVKVEQLIEEEIGRASRRDGVQISVDAVSVKNKTPDCSHASP